MNGFRCDGCRKTFEADDLHPYIRNLGSVRIVLYYCGECVQSIMLDTFVDPDGIEWDEGG